MKDIHHEIHMTDWDIYCCMDHGRRSGWRFSMHANGGLGLGPGGGCLNGVQRAFPILKFSKGRWGKKGEKETVFRYPDPYVNLQMKFFLNLRSAPLHFMPNLVTE